MSAEALQRERRQMQAKHLWYNVDIRWSDLKDKLEVLAPTGLTREDIWRHLFLTKQRKNPYEEGCYTGEDVEDVKQKWEDKKHYFELYKKDVPRPPCIDLDRAILGFNIDNSAAFQAIEDSKALHARRWQTKEGTYCIVSPGLPCVPIRSVVGWVGGWVSWWRCDCKLVFGDALGFLDCWKNKISIWKNLQLAAC